MPQAPPLQWFKGGRQTKGRNHPTITTRTPPPPTRQRQHNCTFSNSPERMDSALLRSALMVGTVSNESRHASNDRCSSRRRTSASAAACTATVTVQPHKANVLWPVLTLFWLPHPASKHRPSGLAATLHRTHKSAHDGVPHRATNGDVGCRDWQHTSGGSSADLH